MSWGTELWDQFDKVTEHTSRGIDFCERYAHFVRDRSRLEQDYASNLRKLVKNYSPKKKEESPYTVVKSFHDSLSEVSDIAGQHDFLAEELQKKIVKEINTLCSELKADRKKHMDEAKRLESQLQSQLKSLEQAKQKYDRSYREQQTAGDIYKTADANLNLSRAEVEKQKTISIQKAQFCSDCKASYAQVLEHTNGHQREYYFKTLPQVFQALQEMDEKRIVKVQGSINVMSEVEKGIQPIINTCLGEICKASEKIDHGEDSRRVVDQFKSGFLPPGDIPFEDLDKEDSRSTNSSNNKTQKADTIGPKSSKARVKTNRGGGLKGLFGGGRAQEVEKEDFSHLTPQQQKKNLQKKIASIKQLIQKETAAREGIVKMYDVYKQNPNLGDAAALNSQLEESQRKIDELNDELNKFEGYLANAEGQGNGGTPVMSRRQSDSSHHSSHSADISASTPSHSTPSHSTPAQITPNNQANVKNSRASTTPSANTGMTDSFDNDSFDEPDPDTLPVLTSASALYPFDATTEGSVSIDSGEIMSVVEMDNGDGWTRIRKSTGDEGFVPTSYIQMQ